MSKAAELANLIGNINAGGGGVNRNLIINGAMNVAQRGTQTSHSSGYTLDRWNVYTTSAARFTISQESDVPSGEGFANSIKLDVTTADSSVASSDFGVFRTILEGQDLQSFCKGTSNAKPFALQFFIKSTVTGTYAIELVDSDNSRAVTKTYTVNSADTWEKKTITFPADTTGAFTDDNNSSLFIQWGLIMGDNYTSGTASGSWESQTTANRFVGQVNAVNSTSNNIFFTGIQLEVGQNPTEFEHEPFEKTLDKCHRYYWKVGASTENELYYRYGNHGESISSSQAQIVVNFPKKMRAQPSYTENGDIRWYSNGSIINPSGDCTIDGNGGGTYAINLVNSNLSGLTSGRAGIFLSYNNTTSFMEWDAEL